MLRVLLLLALASCGAPPAKKTYKNIEITQPTEYVIEKGDQGPKGDPGPQGEQGEPGQDFRAVEEITCYDTVPGFSSAKFLYTKTIFSNGDEYNSAQLMDDDGQLGYASSWNLEPRIYYDKQKNDDWAHYDFMVDYDTLNYEIEYTDFVDGNEYYIVPNKCYSEVLE